MPAFTTQEIICKEGDLVLIRLNNDPAYEGRQRHYNTWWRIKFIDNDNTFVGELERKEIFEFTLYEKGEHQSFSLDKIQRVYKEGEQWCYGDKVTICNCSGLCQNK